MCFKIRTARSISSLYFFIGQLINNNCFHAVKFSAISLAKNRERLLAKTSVLTITLRYVFERNLGVVSFEEILKEQRKQLSGHFQSLVAVVVFVIDIDVISERENHSANHQCHVDGFHLEVPPQHLFRHTTITYTR